MSSSSSITRESLAKLKPEAAVRELSKKKSNRPCFDCGRSGPQHNVNSTHNTFVCTQCAGIHRKYSHKVKTINMSTFTPAEVDALFTVGNKRARKQWLASFEEGKSFPLDPEDPASVDRFMQYCYVEKRWARKEGAADDDEDSGKRVKKDKKAAAKDVTKRSTSVSERAFTDATFPSSITVTTAPVAAAPAPKAPVADLGLDFLSNLTVTESPAVSQPPQQQQQQAAFGFDAPTQERTSAPLFNSAGPGLFDEPAAAASTSASASPAAVTALVNALRSLQSQFGLSAAQLSAATQSALAQMSSGSAAAHAASPASSTTSASSSMSHPQPQQQPQHQPPHGDPLADAFADIAIPDDDNTGGSGDVDTGNPFDSDDEDDEPQHTPSSGAYPPQQSPISPQVLSPQQQQHQQQQSQLSPQQQQFQQQQLFQQQQMYQQQMMFQQQMAMQQGQQQPAAAFAPYGHAQQGGYPHMQQQQQQQPQQQAQSHGQQHGGVPQFSVQAAAPAQPAAPAKPDLFAGFASFN